MEIPLQRHYLYNGKWTAKTDTIILDTIIKLKGDTGWAGEKFSQYFLMTVASEIGAQLGVQFNEAELAIHVKILSLRYRTFKEVVNHPGISARCASSQMIASGGRSCRSTPLLQPTTTITKSEYNKIRCLFDTNDVKEDSHTDLISIPSSSDADSYEDSGCYEVAPDNEKVNSPAVFPKPTVRRKLFDDDVEAADRESTTAKGIYWIDVGPDGNLHTRLKKSRTLPKDPYIKNDGEGTSQKSSHTSSYASNSPIGWWAHLHN